MNLVPAGSPGYGQETPLSRVGLLAPIAATKAQTSGSVRFGLLRIVTGVVGRAMGSGQFGVTDVDLLTKAAIAAYKDNLA